MAKKLFGKKKKKAAEPAAEAKGPLITQLDTLPADSPLKKRVGGLRPPGGGGDLATILGIGGSLGR